MAGSDQANSIEILLNELQELKSHVVLLQNENSRLVEFKNQMLAERDELKNHLSLAEAEIIKLRDQSQMLREYINDVEKGGSSAFEAPRKTAKRCQNNNNQTNIINLGNAVHSNESKRHSIGVTPSSVIVSNNCNNNINNSAAPRSSNNKISKSNFNVDNNSAATISDNKNNSSVAQINNKKKVIQVIDTDLQTIKQKIKSANCNNFTLHQKNHKGPIKIAITNTAEIPMIRESLTTNNLSFHEYKWQEEKSKCFVIKGLVGATIDDIPLIKQELVSAGLPESISLAPLYTGYMRANPGVFHSTLFKLIIPPGVDIKLLLGIKYLDHVAVKFEKIKASVLQCKNCQRFGHSSGGCQHPHRCVKCGENHYRDNCPRTHDKNYKLTCCNCGGEHTANNLTDCQFFLQRNRKTNENKNATNNNNNVRSMSKAVTPGLSFAQVLGDHSKNSIENKLDKLIQLVSCHDAILQKLLKDG